MSSRLPALRPAEVVRTLEKAGWYVHRQKGSHLVMYKAGSSNLLVIPIHNRDLPKGTLHSIVRDAGLTIEEFNELLRK